MFTKIGLLIPLLLLGCDLGKDTPSADGDWNEDTAGRSASGPFGGQSSGAETDGGTGAGNGETTGGTGSTTGTDGGAETGGETGGEGTGTDEEPLPYALDITPSEVDFGVVSVGTSTSQIVDVKNVGTQSLHINEVSVSDRTAFDIAPDFATPITFTPGMERTIRVIFEPSETTTYSERVAFSLDEDDEMEGSSDITLRGQGDVGDCDICSPIIDVSPRDLTIDALLTCSGTDVVYVRNEGDQPLEVSSVNITNDSLALCGTFSTGSGAMTIAPYGEMEITVVYTATSECADITTLGSEENTMQIMSNDPVDPVFSVGLTGYATCVLGFK